MIALLEGILVEKTATRIVVMNSGVGYELLIPLSTYDRLPPPGESCRLLVYDYVREDVHALYGFATPEEKNLFVRLLAVNGVGPKLALAALSGLSPAQLTAAIAAGDTGRISQISGIGKKTAERIIVELKDKLTENEILQTGGAVVPAEDQQIQDAVIALSALGYRRCEARQMVAQVIRQIPAGASVEEIVRRALVARR